MDRNEIYDYLKRSSSDQSIGAWRSDSGDLAIVCRFRNKGPLNREHIFGSLNLRSKQQTYRREITVDNGIYELIEGKEIYKIPAKPRTLSGASSYWEPPCGNLIADQPQTGLLETALTPEENSIPVGLITCILSVV